jgi:histidinol-phosphate aminotransferase
MSRLWSNLVHRLTPYVPGEQPKSTDVIKLNTNENPYPPSPRALAVLQEDFGERLRRYPDPYAHALREVAAGRHGLSSAHAFAGNGSDEVLALAFAAFFGEREDEVGPLRFPDVSYSFYPVWANFFGIPYELVPVAGDLTIDLGRYADGRGGIVFPNPNAPTGLASPRSEIEELVSLSPDSVIVVDEAYIEFGGESAAPLVAKYDNLLVVQTLSKSHSLAGLRVGLAFGGATLIQALDRVKSSFNSYPIDSIAQRVALEALADQAYFEQCRDRVVATREWTSERLGELGFDVLPSNANFVLTRHPALDAEKLQLDLAKQGLLVRWLSGPRTELYLRITIGTDEEMQQLVSALKTLLPTG